MLARTWLHVVQVRLLMLLLGSAQWRLFPLSVQLLSSEHAGMLVSLPQPPVHIPVTIAPMEVSSDPMRWCCQRLHKHAIMPPCHMGCTNHYEEE